MKLWRKDKKSDEELPSFMKSGLIRFNQKLICIAHFLQEKTNHYSTNKKKFLLLVFIAAFITASTVVVIQSVKTKRTASIVPNRIKALPVEKQAHNRAIVTRSEFLRLQRFKNYIDSLTTTVTGRMFRDSLLNNRPQLMDSVRLLINLYLEQLKLKQ